MHTHNLFESKHFILQSIAEGIFVAIAKNGGNASCNSGLINLGGQILVFDTFLTPQAALDLQRFSIERFGCTPQIVINSHYHNDHIWGNQVFAADAQIFSSARTRELIATAGMEELQWYSSNSAQRLESLRMQYQNSNDEREKNELLLWIGEYGGVVEALPYLKVCMPSITFNRHLEIHGAKHTAKLIAFEGAHSGSDTVLYLPQEGIIFMSDLLFVSFHPYLGDGDPLSLLDALRELSQLGATCYVPGHGPVGYIEDLKLLIGYIEQCFDTASRLLATENINEDRIKELMIPEIYRNWQVPQFYTTNIRFLCERLSSSNGGQ
jgi:glyoxylase-like metal-dependent hydrolase (beta-lactamase superfamily II)